MKILNSILGVSIFSALVLVSCGENSLRSGKQSIQSEPQSSSSQLVFGPLNASVAGNISASGNISIDGGKILVDLESTGHTAGTEQMQKVFNLERCPLDTDDANGDGLIDYQEAIGNASVVLPLTSDLTDEGEYPKSTEAGFSYKASGETTLKNEDLNKRVVIIFGVAADKELPDTVAAAPGMEAAASLPISCSLIELEEETQDDSTTTTTTTGDSSTTGMTTGSQEQTTGGKGGYQEQTTGSKGSYQEQTTGSKGGHQEQTTGSKGGHQEQTTGGKGDYQDQTTGHQQQQDQGTALGGDFFTL